MIRTVRVAMMLTTLATISTIASTAISQTTPAKWIDFGNTSTGDRLRLNANSIKYIRMPVDDSINMEGRDDTETAGIAHHRVIGFDYTVGGRQRMAYTTSCQGSNLKTNPRWRTFTTYIDYWPQYFSVTADTAASRNMLARVCKMSATK